MIGNTHSVRVDNKLGRCFTSLLLVWLIVGGVLPASAQVVDAGEKGIVLGLDSPTRISGQYIVVLNRDLLQRNAAAKQSATLESEITQTSESLTVRYGGAPGFRYAHALTGFSIKGIDEKAVAALAADPLVDYVEVDRAVYLAATQAPAPAALDRIDQRYLSLDNSFTYPTSAIQPNVYVIDTGIRASHNEFSGRVLGGYTAIADSYGTDDCNGHGTHVAGIVGGSTYGVAKNANLYPVRVLDCYGGSSASLVLAGVNWVAANYVAPAVVNMSLRIPGPPDVAFEAAVGTLLANNITVVVAAGNQSEDACLISPARLSASSSVITVGNTNSADTRNPTSNFGTCVSLFAPGTDVESAWYTSDSATQVLTGTSMSSPEVAGAAALYLADYPASTPATVKAEILYASTAGVVTNPAVSPNRLLYIGFGEAGGSAEASGEAPGTPGNLTAACTGGGMSDLSWASSSGDVGAYEVYQSLSPTFGTTAIWLGVDTTLSVQGGYYYRVRACNGAGCSGYTLAKLVTISPRCQ